MRCLLKHLIKVKSEIIRFWRIHQRVTAMRHRFLIKRWWSKGNDVISSYGFEGGDCWAWITDYCYSIGNILLGEMVECDQELLIDECWSFSNFEIEISSMPCHKIEKWLIFMIPDNFSFVESEFRVLQPEDFWGSVFGKLWLIIVHLNIFEDIGIVSIIEWQRPVFGIFLTTCLHFAKHEQNVIIFES